MASNVYTPPDPDFELDFTPEEAPGLFSFNPLDASQIGPGFEIDDSFLQADELYSLDSIDLLQTIADAAFDTDVAKQAFMFDPSIQQQFELFSFNVQDLQELQSDFLLEQGQLQSAYQSFVDSEELMLYGDDESIGELGLLEQQAQQDIEAEQLLNRERSVQFKAQQVAQQRQATLDALGARSKAGRTGIRGSDLDSFLDAYNIGKQESNLQELKRRRDFATEVSGIEDALGSDRADLISAFNQANQAEVLSMQAGILDLESEFLIESQNLFSDWYEDLATSLFNIQLGNREYAGELFNISSTEAFGG